MKRTDLALIAAIALAANFAYFVYSNGDFFFPDSPTYVVPAQHVLAGRGFTNSEGEPDALRTPGYPLFLLPFFALGAGASAVVAAQHVLNVLLCIAVYAISIRLTRSRRAAFAAALLLALDTPTIHYANKVLTETLFTCVLLASFFLLAAMRDRFASYGAAGLMCGVLVLIRPVAILWFAVAAMFLFWRHRSARAVVLVLVALVLPLGWAARNLRKSGAFVLSSVAGINMLQHRAAGALAILDDYEFKDALRDRQQELTEDADDEVERELHTDTVSDLPAGIVGRHYERIGRRIVLQHPIGLALLTCRGLLVNLFDSDSDAMMVVSRLSESIVTLAINTWAYFLVFLAMAGILAMWRRHRELAVLTVATVGYFLLISAGSEAEARFRVPVTPMIALAAGLGLAGAFGRDQSNDQGAPLQ